MNKEEIKVSAEVKTYLCDLYNQIEYELREDYKDSLEKTTQALLDIKEYIENFPAISYASTEVVNGKRLSGRLINKDDILDIVNKAIGE